LGSVTEIPTRRQAELLLAERLRSIDYGIQRPNSSRSLRDYAEAYWLPVVLPTLKHSTKKYYQYMLRVHLYPEFGNLQLRLITRDAVQSLLSAKLRSGLSWRTVKGPRTLFGTVMAAAEADELIPSNPVRKTRFPRRGPLGTVQALLGHSSSEITREVYLHSIPADAQAAVQKVEDLLIRPKLTQNVVDWKTASRLIQ